MQKIDNSFKPKLNESNLSFSYKGTELPTEGMIDWFQYEDNPQIEEHFFEAFHSELMDLSYMEMLDVYNKAKHLSYQ